MSEKRFMEIGQRVTVDFDEESYYLDGEYWESWDNYGEEMADAINKEFNKLADENESLKKENKALQMSDTITDYETKIMQLKEENEQLKKVMNELKDMLQRDIDTGVRSYPLQLSEYLVSALEKIGDGE